MIFNLNSDGITPIEKGGTGASTALEAKENLGITKPALGSPSVITLPYTPSEDGFITYFVNTNTNTSSYYYISSQYLNSDISRGSSSGGGYGSSFAANKGDTYSVHMSTNIKSVNMYFTPLA